MMIQNLSNQEKYSKKGVIAKILKFDENTVIL